MTRRIPRQTLASAVAVARAGHRPRSGDLLLGRIEHLRYGTCLLDRDGEAMPASPGDTVLLCLADADDTVRDGEPWAPGARLALVGCNGLVAPRGGGHSDDSVLASIRWAGALVDRAGQALRPAAHALPPPQAAATRCPMTLLCSVPAGPSSRPMSDLVAGLRSLGRQVGVCRLNTTGHGALPADLRAAGALAVLDLVDAGCVQRGPMPMAALERLCSRLLQALGSLGADLVLIEADGGLAQPEVAALLMSQWFRSRLEAVLIADDVDDAAGSGCEWLDSLGIQVLTDTRSCFRCMG